MVRKSFLKDFSHGFTPQSGLDISTVVRKGWPLITGEGSPPLNFRGKHLHVTTSQVGITYNSICYPGTNTMTVMLSCLWYHVPTGVMSYPECHAIAPNCHVVMQQLPRIHAVILWCSYAILAWPLCSCTPTVMLSSLTTVVSCYHTCRCGGSPSVCPPVSIWWHDSTTGFPFSGMTLW